MYGFYIAKSILPRILISLSLIYVLTFPYAANSQDASIEQGQVADGKLRITYVGSNDGAAPITFERHQNVVFLVGKINGSEAAVLLDNAADFTAVDSDFAKRVGLNSNGPIRTVDTGTATIEAKTIEGASLEFPHHITITGRLSSRDLQPLARLMNHKIDAILGGDVINSHALGVIHSQNKIYILPSGRISPRENSVIVPLSNGSELSATINGIPLRLYVDFGSNGAIALSPDAWNRVFPHDRNVGNSRFTGSDGTILQSKVSLGNNVQIGDFRLENIRISEVPFRPRGVDGLLGVDILSRFDVVLDVPAKTLTLIAGDRRRGN